MEQRIPPQNVEAEQAVLGAMLLSHDAVIVAMEKLQSRDFYRDVHRIIFEAMEHPAEPGRVSRQYRVLCQYCRREGLGAKPHFDMY